MILQRLKKSVWRVPLIAIIAGFLYTPCYVRLVLSFGEIEPGVIDDKVSLLVSGFLFVVTLILGWVFLLRKQTYKDIFISSSIVVVYGLLLLVVRFLIGSKPGLFASVFLYWGIPLNWTIFPTELGEYLQEHTGLIVPFYEFIRFFVPWLFVLFGKKSSALVSEQ